MRLSSLSLFFVKIPFKIEFSHSLATRKRTNSLVCVAVDSRGMAGYGEGTPRQYVTGETLDKCKAAAKKLSQEIFDLRIPSSRELLNILYELGSSQISRQNPAAWCAIETAILDLFSKHVGRPIWRLFVDVPRCKITRYSGVLPLVSYERLRKLCSFIESLELNSLKIKLEDPQEGLERLSLVRSALGQDIELRVDFNGATTPSTCLRFLDEARPYNITAIEQPVPKFDLLGLREITRASNIPIIADESMYTEKGPEYLIDNEMCHGLNVRISSCGGILKSLDLLRKCRNRNAICLLGAQVGETTILTAAQRTVAAIFGSPDYIEGGAGAYLLQEDVCIEDMSFGKKGLASISTAPGLGIHIDEQVLAKWSEPIFRLA